MDVRENLTSQNEKAISGGGDARIKKQHDKAVNH